MNIREYKSQLDAIHFSRDFEQRTVELLRRASSQKENASMNRKKTITTIIAVAAAVVLLTTTVFAVSALLSPKEVAGLMDLEEVADAFSSEDAVYIGQSQIVGDYRITLLGLTSGERLDFINGIPVESMSSYVVLAAERTDGTPIAPEDGLLDRSGSELSISPFVEGWAPHMVNAWSLSCAGHGTTVDGVRYYIFDYSNLELFADRTVYLAVYEGFAPHTGIFTLHEDGTITFAEGYTGERAMFTLPVDPSRADPAAARQFLIDMGVISDGDAAQESGEEVYDDVTDIFEQEMGAIITDADGYSFSVTTTEDHYVFTTEPTTVPAGE